MLEKSQLIFHWCKIKNDPGNRTTLENRCPWQRQFSAHLCCWYILLLKLACFLFQMRIHVTIHILLLRQHLLQSLESMEQTDEGLVLKILQSSHGANKQREMSSKNIGKPPRVEVRLWLDYVGGSGGSIGELMFNRSFFVFLQKQEHKSIP